MFSGSLRINLDPFQQYSDGELWVALDVAHLKSFFDKMTAGLDYTISENGENLRCEDLRICVSIIND